MIDNFIVLRLREGQLPTFYGESNRVVLEKEGDLLVSSSDDTCDSSFGQVADVGVGVAADVVLVENNLCQAVGNGIVDFCIG